LTVESLRGKHALVIDAQALTARLVGYRHILIDLGTGDGRFVWTVAEAQPTTLAIGIDACRENLRTRTLRLPPNALYLIANVLALPAELNGLATYLTVNFPWGSLLEALLGTEPEHVDRLTALARPGAHVELRLNAGALAEAGWPLEEGARQVRRTLQAAGFRIQPPVALGPRELRACPTTWGRRLAFGRDPRALELRGVWMGGADPRLP
jgi:16S rRNA (adenine(1408)-N(1))-methyltransferase